MHFSVTTLQAADLKEKLEEEETTTAKLKSELTSAQDQVNALQASVDSLQKQLEQAPK